MTVPVSATRNRLPLLAVLVAGVISEIGSRLTMIALPWFVLQTTGSAAETGLTGFAVALPGFLVGIFGGTLVDRLGYRRSSVIADLVSGLGIGLVPTLHYTIGLPFWLLLALVFTGSLLDIPGLTARRSMLPELVELAQVRLERVNAAFESIQHVSLLIGPPLAGLLIVWLGATTVLWVDAATFLCSSLIIGLAVRAVATPSAADSGSYVHELRRGLSFLLHEPLLRAMAVTLAISNATSAPLFAVILPVYAKRVFGSAADLGMLLTAVGAGSLIGAAGFGIVGPRVPRRVLWFGAYLLLPIVFWVLALRPTLPLLMAGLVVDGIVAGPLNPLMVTIRHERIPPAMRGRVFATYSAISQVASPLGMVLAGFAIARLGFQSTVVGYAVVGEALALGMFAIAALRTMSAPGAASS